MNTIKYLKELSDQEREKFFDSFDLVFCDCDGVIWYPLRDFIPGSAEALAHLESRGKQVTFVTNNSISSMKEHIEKFAQQGNLKIKEHQIVHPAQTICDHLKSINFEGLIYCLATPPFRQVLKDAGFQLTEEGFLIEWHWHHQKPQGSSRSHLWRRVRRSCHHRCGL
ncbi:phosphoglycolate phosphatase 2 isoform X2 [Drosophila serrata]|uniref:phosphoglycolate phosphatase 2 isoform X2 n=1 Tax=Drosophila serrata TaxID=7274 RepID=UPI000A1D27C5|nr:phosphoglycolate phosphatase 2 isoform X2 [Drosophila serrata]